MTLTLPPIARDLRGYGNDPPYVRWPGGARLALSFVVNVEEGAELSLAMGDERNEAMHEVVDPIEGAPNLCLESHFGYGMRAGWPRLRRILREHGVRATMNCCARAIAYSPWIAREAVAEGHEISAHGWRWERQAHMSEAEERAVISRTVAVLRAAAETPPVGWHTRSSASVRTRSLLIEHGGFLYDSNAYDDDMPYVVEVQGRQHVVLPYALDTNDMRFFNGHAFVHGEDFARYCIAAFDRLYEEGAHAPRMMTVGLHLRIIGRPGRIGGLEAFLAHVSKRPHVWIARRDEIARAWRAGLGLPAWSPSAPISQFPPAT
jgi:peptidoglycan/xylan/chitin deacetylase (PgdA/CDA1 family)